MCFEVMLCWLAKGAGETEIPPFCSLVVRSYSLSSSSIRLSLSINQSIAFCLNAFRSALSVPLIAPRQQQQPGEPATPPPLGVASRQGARPSRRSTRTRQGKRAKEREEGESEKRDRRRGGKRGIYQNRERNSRERGREREERLGAKMSILLNQRRKKDRNASCGPQSKQGRQTLSPKAHTHSPILLQLAGPGALCSAGFRSFRTEGTRSRQTDRNGALLRKEEWEGRQIDQRQERFKGM